MKRKWVLELACEIVLLGELWIAKGRNIWLERGV